MNNISPEIFRVGPMEVRWYGVLFALGLMAAYFVSRRIFKDKKFSAEDLDSVAIYLVVGLVVGARMGHVLFYNTEYFFSNPVEILKIWNGGLASHGAAIGVLVAYLVWIKVHKASFGKYADALVFGFPLVAAAVRIGNFFNSEIVGVETGGEWGVVFARLGEAVPRHPAQLYEAALSLVIFGIFVWIYRRGKKVPEMFFMFLYMLLYFAGRFGLEFFKDLHAMPDWSPISMGQVLSLPFVVAALVYFVVFYPRYKKKK